ncbi:hypothetical protein HMPREF9714_00954 [Myroides odoratimimus CCUG 12901]|uniref:hypothetical protein n=1 Tax=Myroides TaxID=76831 RepID=UPI0002460D4E|nr:MULTISPECIES: hypothetical protein [Myroides]EHO13120.1 hypothetical protein HMPREF9714_00954 [Myroides odoratimimus CCUG 12901]MDX4974115.1 hypothetical protein [Myroides odoratimimus]
MDTNTPKSITKRLPIYHSLLMLLLIMGCKSLDKTPQLADNKITIQGRVTVKATDSVPLGLTTMNIKNKWVWKNQELQVYGENERVFVDKKGYYKIQIEKTDTLVLIPNYIIYGRDTAAYTFTDFTKDEILNISVEPKNKEYEAQVKNNPTLKNYLDKHVQTVDPEKLITIKGNIYSKKTQKPLKNVDVGSAFNNNTEGTGTYHLTDTNGAFSIKVPKGSMCSVWSLSPNVIRFYPQNDTIVNLYM